MGDSVDNFDNELLFLKKKKLELFRMFDLFLRIVLTLVGTVSFVSILMFLNVKFGISYFSCLVLILTVPFVYSTIINILLERLDNKIEGIKKDITDLEIEFDKCCQQDRENIIKNIEIRFDGLSNDKKKKLLNYIKINMVNDSFCEYISKLEDDDVLVLLDDMDETVKEESIYSRKRTINDK